MRLYDLAVQQSRLPVFYKSLSVPDTLTGRFDLILLHAFPVLSRAGREIAEKETARRLAQDFFDVMFTDMDRSARERGVGDLSVPRHMKQMMQAFRGRVLAYEAAGNDKHAMIDALARNLYGSAPARPAPEILEKMYVYVNDCAAAFHVLPWESLLAGKAEFPQFKEYGRDEQEEEGAGAAAARVAA